MNLKEAFRHQNYLDGLMNRASTTITMGINSMVSTETHKRHAANPEAEDFVKTSTDGSDYLKMDDLIGFIQALVVHRGMLATAIALAKEKSAVKLDAIQEENKFRRQAADAINNLLQKTRPGTNVHQATAYKLNAEGAQVPYVYDVEVVTTDNFDRTKAKCIVKKLRGGADVISADIDKLLIETKVDYHPLFDVNDDFEDAVERYLLASQTKADGE